MVRLQLKRRLKYKAVWEEQLINPTDVRDALFVLTKKHPGYKNIQIAEIDENYLVSDKQKNNTDNEDTVPELMCVDEIPQQETIEETERLNEEHLKRLAIGDVKDTASDDEEIEEDDRDIRAKYNIGTDSCTQPADFNDFVTFDKDPHVVAPGEKNKLSSMLTDKSIEALAFPHLFPDGRGSFNEERVTDLKWKEYCRTRLFSSDSRFASDSSYIFFLQYLGDLKQAFSGINIAFRKQLPMTARQSIDEIQMKFLMAKDMIYRYLQSVRGSPQYWHQRLKDLFGMTRQLGCPTFFITLSCADMRWKEFVDTFVRHTGGIIKESYTFAEKAKLLRGNPVLAARMFERRFNNFMNLFVKGGAWCLGKVKDWFSRIEMQFRGSPHAHMPTWVKDAPKYIGLKTDKKTREDIVKFCDKYITTRFPSLTEDAELHYIIKEVQTHSRSHSKSCLKYRNTICRFGFPRPVARRTFICEPFKVENDDDKERVKNAKKILIEMNASMNTLEKEKPLTWLDFDALLEKYGWSYEYYEWSLTAVHSRPTMIHKREPNARWVNQYNEEMLRAWNANMDIQFVLDPYACAKYLMSYTTKPEREMSLLLEATHKECREGNMPVREEMKKLTGTFFNHRQVSVQEAIYRATKMPLTYSSRGFVFVPAHSNSCKFLKPHHVLTRMNADDTDIYMSNLADKYFDRPLDPEFNICMADFASEYDIVSVHRTPKKPKTPIKRLQKLAFGVKKRCGRNAIIRYPHFNRETDAENYFENLLSLYLPIRTREELKKPFQMFYEIGEVFDVQRECMRKVKDIVCENRKKYEAHFEASDEMESVFTQLSKQTKENDWAEIVANKEKNGMLNEDLENEENPDFDMIRNKTRKSGLNDLKQLCSASNEMRPLLESMNNEQQEVFYRVREWCVSRLHNPDVEPIRLFITGGAGTGKSHLLKCLQYEATKIFSRKKHLEPDENIDEIHTLITAFTGAAALNVSGVTIHKALGISTYPDRLNDNLSCDTLNTYRCIVGSLKLLFVDEVSLIQESLWGAMHSRLSQIMGVHSNTAIFGNVGIVAIGDFYQCAPVASSSIYSSLLWSDHFEYVQLTINERQNKKDFFPQMLSRIRKMKRKAGMTQEDRDALTKCHHRYLKKEYHPEALHLFGTNADVDAHNNKMIDQVCNNIRTFYEIDRKGNAMKPTKNKYGKMLHVPLRLAKNARIMITQNISTSDGLANGVIGRVVGFVENSQQDVSRVVIKCDSITAGRAHRSACLHCREHGTVCVTRENDKSDRQDSNLISKPTAKQFPLRLSWAITIHKAQGLTVDEIVISTKDLFGSGMGYTALSRVRTIEGLFLIDLHFDRFFCDKKIEKMLSQMKPIRKKECIFREAPHFLNIIFHNIEGLHPNLKALRSHHLTKKAHLICLAETWLSNTSRYDGLTIDGFRLIHRARSDSFATNHTMHSIKRGGVGVYVREDICVKEIEASSALNLENITVELESDNITVITCYRSPQQEKKQFLASLTCLLESMDIAKRILLVGDLNENSFQSQSKTMEDTMRNFGFVNMFADLATTNDLTSLDCVYTNFIGHKDRYRNVINTFYSYHDAIAVSINMNVPKNDVVAEVEYEKNDEQMDVDTSLDSTISFDVSKEISSKRKKACNEKYPKKKSKGDSVKPTPVSERTRERELKFLSNLKIIRSKLVLADNERTTSSLSEQLNAAGLRKINVAGDGNCFFRALSHQLHGHENNHSNLRAAGITYLIENSNRFLAVCPFDAENFHNYIVEMSNNGTFADHLVILATASILNQNVIIHEYGFRPLLIPGSDFIDHQIHVSYDPNGLHYESVKQLDGTTPFFSFADLQTT